MSLNTGIPLDRLPSGRPPPGVTPNFVDPPSYASEIRILEGVFVSLMLAAVLVRVYVRLRLVKAWGWDDYLCIAAAFGSLAHLIMYTQSQYMTSQATGMRLQTVDPLYLLQLWK
jgi:hypothetical protein